jgi:hypothetical protein
LAEKCYWCGKVATSREHVPPKCLFPEKKDIEHIYDVDYRKSLVTVPSCDEHNLKKSHDDEYLMVCLGSIVGNNGIAYIHTNTKIRRTLKRNPTFLSIVKEDNIELGGKEFPVLYIYADNMRLVHSFEAIARALVFHEFKFSYQGRCQVISDLFVTPKDIDSSHFQETMATLLLCERDSWTSEIKGANPKIFTYQFSDRDCFGSFSVALTFYEKTIVYVVMSLQLK